MNIDGSGFSKGKIVIVPDSFKGSMTSLEVCDVLFDTSTRAGFEAECIPIADGGEGSIDCLLNVLGGQKKYVDVIGPQGEMISAYYGITNTGIAVLEIAESSGITKQNGLHAMTSNTLGFGQLIKAALDDGHRDFLICLGGSATTDCGLGMAVALGAKCFDSDNNEIIPCGANLIDIKRISIDDIDERIYTANFKVMSDVTNPLYGENGAAYVFSPQKGASKEEVELLDRGLKNVSKLISEAAGVLCESVKGAGAAGGAGYGCVAFLKSEIQSGIEAVLDIVDFDNRIKDCVMIFTGEGKLDHQSLMGKVLSGIKAHAGDIPIVSFCGISECDRAVLSEAGISVVEIGRGIPLEDSLKNGKMYLKKMAETFFEQF